MGLFTNITKTVKSLSTSKLGKAVVDVARKVKKTAGAFISGIAGKDGLIAKAYGKIKSFGTLALDKVFPKANPSSIRALQSATASTQAAGGLGFVTAVSSTLGSAALKTPTSSSPFSITKWFSDGFSYIGGKVKDGASYVYDSTMNFFGTKDPTKIENQGDWILKDIEGKRTISPQATTVTALANNPEFVKMANYSGTTSQELIKKQADYLESAKHLGTTVEQNPEFLKMANYSGTTPQDISKKQTEFLKQKNGTGLEALSKANDQSFLSKAFDLAKEYGPDLLQGFGSSLASMDAGAPYVPGRATQASQVNANRSGVGGRGAGGGDFLSSAQQEFFNKQRGQLERVG